MSNIDTEKDRSLNKRALLTMVRGNEIRSDCDLGSKHDTNSQLLLVYRTKPTEN